MPYKPRFVVYYCGSNDVNARQTAADVVARIRDFHERLERALPSTRMFFVSVIRAPDKRARWAVVDSINAQVRAYGRWNASAPWPYLRPPPSKPSGLRLAGKKASSRSNVSKSRLLARRRRLPNVPRGASQWPHRMGVEDGAPSPRSIRILSELQLSQTSLNSA